MIHPIKLTSVATLFSCVAASAIEIPTPEAPKAKEIPKEAADQIKPKQNPAQAVERMAYLGVAGESIGEVLTAQLGLNNGIALNLVQPNSPASAAGLQKNDIIVQLAGRKIASQNDLRKTMFGLKPNSVVDVTIVRKGKELKQKLTLGSRAKQKVQRNPLGNGGKNLRPGLNNGMFMVPGGGMNLKELQRMGIPQQQAEELLKLLEGGKNFKLPKGFNQGMKQLQPGARKNGFNFAQSMTMNDGQGSVTLKTDKKGKNVTVKDKEGNIIFDGPMNNADDKLAIPEDILKRIEDLGIDKKNNRFKFNIK